MSNYKGLPKTYLRFPILQFLKEIFSRNKTLKSSPGIFELDKSIAGFDQNVPEMAVVLEETLQILLTGVLRNVA